MAKVHAGGWRELAGVVTASTALAVALTYPLAVNLGRSGRVENGDARWSIWIVAWVARTLVVDPLRVFDANIFFPHRGTLAYSENSLGAGALAVPVYWMTRNPFAAHNFVVLAGFVLSATGMYYLVRHLTHDRRAAAVSAICFAFCPYIFGHLLHIQLLMTAGLPLSMLAFHRMVESPTPARGAMLGLAMAAQAIFCGYYGLFVVLMVGYSVVVVAVTRRFWKQRAFWIALATGAAVGVALVTPILVPYWRLVRVSHFTRPLAASLRYSANWSSYLASSSYAHVWMLRFIAPWQEVAFPGIVATLFGIAGLWSGLVTRGREVVVLYGGLILLAAWASYGPQAGLYAGLYAVVPGMSLLRAPSRFGLVVAFGLSVLAGVALSRLLEKVSRPNLAGGLVAAAAVAELAVPMGVRLVPPEAPVYHALSLLPSGPVIEMPFFYRPPDFFRHTEYMLASTSHWMPLVNGYSDYIPEDFIANVLKLAPFPSGEAFKLLEPDHVRYAIFHMKSYNSQNRQDVVARLQEFKRYLRPVFEDEQTRLYEIIGYPP